MSGGVEFGNTPRNRPRMRSNTSVDTTDSDQVEPRSSFGWCCDKDANDDNEDPDREVRERQEQEHETIFIGYGKVGFYSPMAFFALPFQIKGSILPAVLPVVLLAAGVGCVALGYDWHLDSQLHSILGFVLGFLLVILGNFSHSRYNTAITAVNQMVQDGLSLSVEVFSHLKAAEMGDQVQVAQGANRLDAFASERAEFRRLVILYFRLACYEVRADIQARKNRYTWLDPDGGVCTDEERNKFLVATDRWSQREWTYSHAGRIPSLGCEEKGGRFMVTVRPAVVQTWISKRLCYYASIGVLGANASPLQAQLLGLMEQYTRHLSTFITIDRTPMPFSYVQMTATILLLFIFTLPLSLVETLGQATPFGAALFAYAYYGLYVNACQLCNPFNYDKTLTGVPINAFIQRLDALTGAALLDCNDEYQNMDDEVISPFSSIFKTHVVEKNSPRKSRPPSPRSPRSHKASFTNSFTAGNFSPKGSGSKVSSPHSTPGLTPADLIFRDNGSGPPSPSMLVDKLDHFPLNKEGSPRDSCHVLGNTSSAHEDSVSPLNPSGATEEVTVGTVNTASRSSLDHLDSSR